MATHLIDSTTLQALIIHARHSLLVDDKKDQTLRIAEAALDDPIATVHTIDKSWIEAQDFRVPPPPVDLDHLFGRIAELDGNFLEGCDFYDNIETIYEEMGLQEYMP